MVWSDSANKSFLTSTWNSIMLFQQQSNYEESMKIIASFQTVEHFWRVYDHLIRPNEFKFTTDYHLFKEVSVTRGIVLSLQHFDLKAVVARSWLSRPFGLYLRGTDRKWLANVCFIVNSLYLTWSIKWGRKNQSLSWGVFDTAVMNRFRNYDRFGNTLSKVRQHNCHLTVKSLGS